MERALSTYLFGKRPLTVADLRQVEQAGVPAVEIFANRRHFDYLSLEHVRELGAWFRDHAVRLRSLHSPLYRDNEVGRSALDRTRVNIADPERLQRIESVDEIKRALEVAEQIPFDYMVLHLGIPNEDYSQKKFDAAYSSLEPLLVFAKQRGVTLLLENIPNELSTPARLKQFIEYTRLDDLLFCFDTGHAHQMGGVEADFDSMSPRVASLHLHDNNGDRDDHLFPFQGGIDWEGAMAAFAAAPRPLPVQMEVRDHGEFPKPVEKAVETFERLEALLPAENRTVS